MKLEFAASADIGRTDRTVTRAKRIAIRRRGFLWGSTVSFHKMIYFVSLIVALSRRECKREMGKGASAFGKAAEFLGLGYGKIADMEAIPLLDPCLEVLIGGAFCL